MYPHNIFEYDGCTLEDLNLIIKGLSEGQRLIVNNLPDNLYRQADGFSTSDLKNGDVSPAHWKAAKDKGYERKKHFDFGTVVHWAVLEPEKIETELLIKPIFELKKNEDKQNYIAWMCEKIGEWPDKDDRKKRLESEAILKKYRKWMADNTEVGTKTITVEKEAKDIKPPKVGEVLKEISSYSDEFTILRVKMPTRTNANKQDVVNTIIEKFTEEQKNKYETWLNNNTEVTTKNIKEKKEVEDRKQPSLSDQYKFLESIFPYTCVSKAEYEEALKLSKKIGGFQNGLIHKFTHKEIAGFYKKDGIILKGKADAINTATGVCLDVKTTDSVVKEFFLKKACDFKYDWQAFDYLEIFDLQEFRWLGVEKKEPYAIAPFKVFRGDDWLEEAGKKVLKVANDVASAIEANFYPEPYSEFEHIEPAYIRKRRDKVDQEEIKNIPPTSGFDSLGDAVQPTNFPTAREDQLDAIQAASFSPPSFSQPKPPSFSSGFTAPPEQENTYVPVQDLGGDICQ